MKKLKSQSGRSMVEMLGVLAIIGVLSVGGIAGYSHAMRRHRANGVADTISKFALISYNLCQQKVLSGEIANVSSCEGNLNGFQMNYDFENAGLGSLPAGVSHIHAMRITPDKTTGIDTISISAAFDDDKLCQAVGSIFGSNCSGQALDLPIKQN